MTGIMWTRVVATIILVLGVSAAGRAQGGDQAGPARGRAGRAAAEGLNPAEVVRLLDGWAVMEAQRTLELTDDQFAQFVTRLRRLQEVRPQNQRERNRMLQDLRRMAGPRAAVPPDEATLRERLKALRDHDERAHADARKAYDAVEETLDVGQQARFRLFEEMIELRKLDLLVRARERAAARGGRDGGGD
jgi:hypothetical protein